MSIRVIDQDRHKRTRVMIPAFIRDKFNLQHKDKVDIDTDGEVIIIKPLKSKGGGGSDQQQ
jgi:AbrB family looped-hinge helix DNA binding protein